MSDVSFIDFHDAEISSIRLDAGGCEIQFSHLTVYSWEQRDTYGVWSFDAIVSGAPSAVELRLAPAELREPLAEGTVSTSTQPGTHLRAEVLLNGVDGTLVLTGMLGGIITLIGTMTLTLGRRRERIETWRGPI